MTPTRAFALAASGAAFAFAAAPAQAQVTDQIVLNIMRECAKIGDASARLACYDNNIGQGEASGRQPVSPGDFGTVRGTRPSVSTATAPQASGPSGFGREAVKTDDRFSASAAGADSLTARVASVRERQPGTYLITLEDGAEWLFSEGVPNSYRPPRAGSTVEIRRASLGSFLFHFDNQAPARIRRIK